MDGWVALEQHSSSVSISFLHSYSLIFAIPVPWAGRFQNEKQKKSRSEEKKQKTLGLRPTRTPAKVFSSVVGVVMFLEFPVCTQTGLYIAGVVRAGNRTLNRARELWK
jgi:hypothetical protein